MKIMQQALGGSIDDGIRIDYASSSTKDASVNSLDEVLNAQKYAINEKMNNSHDSNSISKIKKTLQQVILLEKRGDHHIYINSR